MGAHGLNRRDAYRPAKHWSIASATKLTSSAFRHSGGTMRRIFRCAPDLLIMIPCSRAASKTSAVSAVAGSLSTPVAHQFNRQHQPAAPDIADQIVPLLQCLQSGGQQL